ncbi:MAG: hypothetical protein IT371_02685 [Deltaproteobacteria bacterium]|nr:hypothetical protein [Deltaproteobacteria bacterium]
MTKALLILSTVVGVNLAHADGGPKTPLDAFRRVVGGDPGLRVVQGGNGILRILGGGQGPLTVRLLEEPQPQWLRPPNLVDLVLGTRAHGCQRHTPTTGAGVTQTPVPCHTFGDQVGAYVKRLLLPW